MNVIKSVSKALSGNLLERRSSLSLIGAKATSKTTFDRSMWLLTNPEYDFEGGKTPHSALVLDGKEADGLGNRLSPRNAQLLSEAARKTESRLLDPRDPSPPSLMDPVVVVEHGAGGRSEDGRHWTNDSHEGDRYPDSIRPASRFGAVEITGDSKLCPIGNVGPDGLDALAQQVEGFSRQYSLGGRDKPIPPDAWTNEERLKYLDTGIPPKSAENCVDFVKDYFRVLARHGAKEGREGLNGFLKELDGATMPDKVHEIVTRYFAPGKDGSRVLKSEQ